MLEKIVSGGQTGADRAALDFAIKHKIPHGGWIPKGRLAEDGPLSAKYKLTEIPTDSYQERTEQNVKDSDGTVIISRGKLTGGSAYTLKLAKKHNRPYFHVDLKQYEVLPAALEILSWLDDNSIKVMNVAGPRASKDPKIYKKVREVLEGVLILEASRDQLFVSLKLSKTPTNMNTKRPDTVLEAVDQLMKELDLAEKAKISKMAKDGLIRLHLTVGMYIRNRFFYPHNENLLESCRDLTGDKHLNIDHASSVIIRELWKKLQETHKLKVVK